MRQVTSKTQQRGATFLGGLTIAAILGLALYVVIRLYPAYWEYYEVVSSMQSLAKQSAGTNPTPEAIRNALSAKWSAGYVETVKPEDIVVTKDGDGLAITADYRVERPFIGNISLVVDFYKTVKVN